MSYHANRPGQYHILYRQYDEANRLLYVGITTATKRRTSVSFEKPYTLLDHKTRQPWLDITARIMTHKTQSPWYHLIKTVTVEPFADRKTAENAERWAIKHEKPGYNKRRLQPKTPLDYRYEELHKRGSKLG